MTTMVRDRVSHSLKLGETEDSKTKVKYVHCTYTDGSKVYELNLTGKHPHTRISVSMQDDILWTSDKPFSIDLKPRDKAAKLFFRNKFPWNSVESVIDHKHRVHSGALDPGVLPMAGPIELKFTATQLVSPNGPTNDNVKKLDPHIIVEP